MSTTLDEARERLDHETNVWTRKAVEALIDAKLAIFREEIAQLSRAPVGEDGVRYETVTVTDHGDGFDISRADQERLGLVGDQHYEIVEFLSDRRATIAIPTPPAKDTGEEEIIADLEQRLIEAKTERDEARSSLETAERRIGELEKALNSQALPIDRETLGRMVREAWIRWAQTQPAPKSSWLVPYDGLAEHDKEADRQIGEAVAKWTLVHAGARAALTPDAGTARSEDEEE